MLIWTEQNSVSQSLKKKENPQSLDLPENTYRKTRICILKTPKSQTSTSYILYPTKQLKLNLKWNGRWYLQEHLRWIKTNQTNKNPKPQENHFLWKSFSTEWDYLETYSSNCTVYLPLWEMYFCKRSMFMFQKMENLPSKEFSSDTNTF